MLRIKRLLPELFAPTSRLISENGPAALIVLLALLLAV